MQGHVPCITTKGIHNNDILFAIKTQNKRLQSSDVLLGVVIQINRLNFLQKYKETECTFANIKAIQIASATDAEYKTRMPARMHARACVPARTRTHTHTHKQNY